MTASLPAFAATPKNVTSAAAPGVGSFLHVKTDGRARRCGPLKPARMKRWLALARGGDPYWQGPHWGTKAGAVPPETQFLLWEREDGRFGLCLPLIAGDTRATLSGREGALYLAYGGALDYRGSPELCLAWAGVGEDPDRLVEEGMHSAREHLRAFRLRQEKETPAVIDWLGWGTWDAYKQTIDARKFERALKSFHQAGIALGFVILDDGWQDATGDYLNSFAVNAEKFPGGLRALAQKARERYGLKFFGIWLAFEGYWAGLNPEGELAGRFRTVSNEAVIRPWIKPHRSEALHLVHPDDAHRFFAEYLRTLAEAGVDFVKVDGQSALELFTAGRLGRVGTMRVFQEGLQGAAAREFRNNLLHCMCNGSDIVYHLKSSSLWRNSNDYFPGKEPVVQQRHVVQNAYNNVWMRTVAWPDWDFFQSHRPEASFHAAARALSGGPVYFDDEAGKADAGLLKRLTTSDGRLLRCPEPARVARDRLFTNVRAERRLLKVVNTCAHAGLIGLFHCCETDAAIEDRFRAGDCPGLAGNAFALWLHRQERVLTGSARSAHRIECAPMGWEIATVAPVRDGLAALGLLEKYNGAAAIERWERGGEAWTCDLRDGGVAGFYCERQPRALSVNGRARKVPARHADGLLRLNLPEGAPHTVSVVPG